MLAPLVLGRNGSQLWSEFVALVDRPLKRPPEEGKDSAERAAEITRILASQPEPSEELLYIMFENAHRPRVTLPVGCVATRLGDPVIVDALLAALSWEEVMRTVGQDIADDHGRGMEAIARSSQTSHVEADHRGWAVTCAVESGSNRALTATLRWAHAAGSLSILCSDPRYHEEDVWHLPVFENALQIAVRAAVSSGGDTSTLEAILYAPLVEGIYPLTANQKVGVLKYILQQGSEESLSVYLQRFPELTAKINAMVFSDPAADSLRRRCVYRLMFEPRDSNGE